MKLNLTALVPPPSSKYAVRYLTHLLSVVNTSYEVIFYCL